MKHTRRNASVLAVIGNVVWRLCWTLCAIGLPASPGRSGTPI